MSYFDDASLAFLPSGAAGKDGKAYSIKPTDGDGDFDFSRGSNLAATRINSDGLIEKGRENLLLQSNQFDTTWTTTNATLTSGQSGYDGSLDAWELQSSGGTNWVVQLISNNGIYTFSVYAKSGTTDWMRINILQSGGNANNYYDIANGLKGASPSSAIIDDKIESVGNGWYRISIVSDGSITQIRIQTAVSDGNETSVSGDNIYIQSAQLEIGLVSTDYITSGATKGKAGILENTPRFNYGDGASCPSLLLEPSATQLIGYSEYMGGFDQLVNVSISTNNAISPEGVQNATKVSADAVNDKHEFKSANINFTSGVKYTASVFVKSSGYDFAYIKFASTASVFNEDYAWFNISDGAKGTIDSDVTAIIEPYGNDWYRITASRTALATGSGKIFFGIGEVDNTPSFMGDGTSGAEFFGFQIEANSYPTSYVPNHSGGTITRAADVCGGAGDVNTFNSTEGVLYAEVSALADDLTERRLSISNGSSSNVVRIGYTSVSDRILAVIYNGSNQAILTYTSSDIAANSKIALKYKENDFALWVNGVEVATDNSGSTFLLEL